MTPATLAKLIRKRTKTTQASFSDDDILLEVNTWMYEISKDIVEANEDYFAVRATRDLVADQREYTLPNDVLNRIKFVEAKLDPEGESIPLYEFDIASYKRPTSEAQILTNFRNVKGGAFYDIYGNSLLIYSGALVDVADGLKLHYISEPDEITDLSEDTIDISLDTGSSGIGFPKQFHELLARRVVIQYKADSKENIPLSEKEQLYNVDLQKALDSIKTRNESNTKIPNIPLVHGNNSSVNSLPFALQTDESTDSTLGYNL